MSADNGIYIIKDKKGYRVTHAQCIENLWWWNKKNPDSLNDDNIEDWEEKSTINPKIVEEYFKGCKYFKTAEEAHKEAERIYEEIMNDDFCPIVEYGIVYLGEIKEK